MSTVGKQRKYGKLTAPKGCWWAPCPSCSFAGSNKDNHLRVLVRSGVLEQHISLTGELCQYGGKTP